MNWIIRFYLLALRFFPRRFYENFALEMPEVFADALHATSRRGAAARAGFLLRELADLPMSILREHVYAMRAGNAGLNTSMAGSTPGGSVSLGAPGSPPRAASWEVLLAGLPHVLVALAMGLTETLRAITGTANRPLDIFVNITLLAGALTALLLVILRRGRAWAGSWYSYWFVAIFLAALRGHEALFPGRGFEYNMEGAAVNVISPLIFAFFLYSVARRDRVKGLLAAMPLTLIVWLPYMESTPRTIIDPVAKGIVMLVSWLLLGFAAAYTVRSRRPGVSLWLALLPLFIGGPVIVWLAVYQGGVLPYAENGPSLAAVAQFYLRTLLITASFLLAPQLAINLRAFSQRISAKAVWFYRVGMAGMLLAFAGSLNYARQTYNAANQSFSINPDPLSSGLLFGGYALFLLSFALILFAALRQPEDFSLPELAASFILIGLVPVILFLGTPMRMYAPLVPLPLLISAALAWIGASGWMAAKQR